jgi:uncharacterized protein YeaO (DUF488 family)
MVVKTKSIFQKPDKTDGLRILVTRFYPRGIKKDHFDLWLKELAPSSELLLRYKNGNYNWEIFKEIFLYEIANNIDSLDTLYTLHEQSVYHDITLLCYERNGSPCHRHFVKDLIESPMLLNSFFESKNAND